MALTRCLPILFLLALLPASAQALSVVYLDLDELTAASDAVVLVTVDRSVHLDPNAQGVAFTDTTVFVERSLHGHVPAVMTVRHLGGVTAIPGAERYTRGESCILFLRQAEGRWWLTATGQSKMTLADDGGELVATRSVEASAYRRDRGGELQPHRPERTVLSFDAVRRRVALAAIAAWKERQR